MSQEMPNMGRRSSIPFLDGIPAPRGVPHPEQIPPDASPSGDTPQASATPLSDARRTILAANRGPYFRDPHRKPPDGHMPGTNEPPPPPDGPDLVPRTPRPKVLV